MTTYQFSERNGMFHAERVDKSIASKSLFVTERGNGYGASGVFPDWELPAGIEMVRPPAFFEYHRPDIGEYYRIDMADVVFDVPMPDPAPLAVRHTAWPGMDAAEIRAEMMARRRRAIAKAIERAEQRKAYEAEQARLRAEEERLRAEIAAEMDSEMSEEEAIRQALAAAGLEDWA